MACQAFQENLFLQKSCLEVPTVFRRSTFLQERQKKDHTLGRGVQQGGEHTFEVRMLCRMSNSDSCAFLKQTWILASRTMRLAQEKIICFFPF